MKVAINKCYGGFGLSHEAIMLLAKKKGIELYDNGEVWQRKYYTLPDCGKESFFNHLDLYYTDRSDKSLIEVIEELQEKANADYSKLCIIEIPDGTKYSIENYDGYESIHEIHRVWR